MEDIIIIITAVDAYFSFLAVEVGVVPVLPCADRDLRDRALVVVAVVVVVVVAAAAIVVVQWFDSYFLSRRGWRGRRVTLC